MSIQIDHLPSELKQGILSHLYWDDLNNMCLVSKSWNKEAEDPKLWENFGQLFNWSVEPISSDKELKMLFRMKRFKSLKHIAIHEKFTFSKSNIQLLSNQNLQSLDLGYCDMSSAPSDLLATLLGGLEKINLRSSILANSFKIKLFTELKASNKLRNLIWPSADFTCLNPSLLASVLSRLDFAVINYSRFNPKQLEQFFSDIADGDRKMKRINFECTRLSSASPKALARGLVKVETLDLQYTYLTQHQVTEFFKLVSAGGSSLKNLDMRWEGSNLEKVDPTVLASAVNKLEYARFDESRLQPKQIEAILMAVDENSTLKSLNLAGMSTIVCEGNKFPGEEEKNWKNTTLGPLLARARRYCKVLTCYTDYC